MRRPTSDNLWWPTPTVSTTRGTPGAAAAASSRIRYDGGTGSGAAHIDVPAVRTLNAKWRTVDGCATPSLSTAGVA